MMFQDSFSLLDSRYTLLLFFFNATATTEIYTLSLHDALPIYGGESGPLGRARTGSSAYPGPPVLHARGDGTRALGDHVHHRRHPGGLRTHAAPRRGVPAPAREDGVGRVARSVRGPGRERVRSEATHLRRRVEGRIPTRETAQGGAGQIGSALRPGSNPNARSAQDAASSNRPSFVRTKPLFTQAPRYAASISRARS